MDTSTLHFAGTRADGRAAVPQSDDLSVITQRDGSAPARRPLVEKSWCVGRAQARRQAAALLILMRRVRATVKAFDGVESATHMEYGSRNDRLGSKDMTPTGPGFAPTPEQEAILGHDLRGHARVLAGPGTGKSATLVALIEQHCQQEPPPRIRLLTFTRAATAELARKVAEHPAAAIERPSTVHSFSISVLLRNRGAAAYPEPLRLADEWEEDQVVRASLARRSGVHKSRIKNLITEMAAKWEALEERDHPKVRPEDRASFLGVFEEHRWVFGYTLLAELPDLLRRAVRDHDDLEGLDYEALIVDEYQDLNACDLELLRLIGDRGCSIIGAGDDDQSIYSFRRAAPEGIRRFRGDYPECGDYPLSVSQRCGSRILDWALHVIEGDPDRPARPRLGSAPGVPEGRTALLSFADDRREASGVAALIARLILEEHVPPSEILVLLRADQYGSFSTPIKEQLRAAGIEYSDPGAVKVTLSEERTRRLLAMLRLLVQREDSIAWASLLTLTQGIGTTFFDRIYENAAHRGDQFGATLLAAHVEGFPGVAAAVANRATSLVSQVLEWLDSHPVPEQSPEEGWGTWMIAQAGSTLVPIPSDAFVELLQAVDGMVEEEGDLGRYLGQLTPLGKDWAQAHSDGVRFMTMASSKGLTVRAAILVALERGLLPRPDQDAAEERRLLYVAMTRAREHVYGTWARTRTGPTARAGAPNVRGRRALTPFLEGGPVESQSGDAYLREAGSASRG